MGLGLRLGRIRDGDGVEIGLGLGLGLGLRLGLNVFQLQSFIPNTRLIVLTLITTSGRFSLSVCSA